MSTSKIGLGLSWRASLLAIPSFAVYLFNDRLLAWHGAPSSPVPTFPANIGSHLESGARLEFLASLILFTGVAAAVVAACVVALLAISRSARHRIAIGAVALIAAAWLVLWLCPTPGFAQDIGLPDACPVEARGPPCVARYVEMLNLLFQWKKVLIVATAVLILGTICCLADAALPATKRVRIAVLKRQAMHLNLFLYLSAMLMVSALLVQLTFLRWPRFAISAPDIAPFDAHVGAIMLYYGVGYSVFLASYYLPVAFWLSRRAEGLGEEGLRDEIFRTTTTGSAGVAKAAASILAPALAGLLSAWIDLPG